MASTSSLKSELSDKAVSQPEVIKFGYTDLVMKHVVFLDLGLGLEGSGLGLGLRVLVLTTSLGGMYAKLLFFVHFRCKDN